jgi:outer membrane protein OmpA-like peptidoglycan-associated protein
MLADELKGRSDTYDHIILEGFTDSQEPDPVRLSRQRSEAVRDALFPALPGVFMEIIPRGPATPLAPNETAYGRERNRRVQVYLAAEEVDVPEPITADGE